MSQGIYPAIFQRSTTFLTKFLLARQVGLLSNMGKTDCPCTGQYFQTGKENAISNIYSLKALLMTRSNMQNNPKSVHSTRRYSKNKASYQDPKMEEEMRCRAKIDHPDSRKHPIIYTGNYSPLSEDSKTLTFVT